MTKIKNSLDEESVLSWNIFLYKELFHFRCQGLLLLGTQRLTYNSQISLSELLSDAQAITVEDRGMILSWYEKMMSFSPVKLWVSLM